jgi:hypothetical protein
MKKFSVSSSYRHLGLEQQLLVLTAEIVVEEPLCAFWANNICFIDGWQASKFSNFDTSPIAFSFAVANEGVVIPARKSVTFLDLETGLPSRLNLL